MTDHPESGQKTNKETQAVNDTSDHKELTDTYRIYHPKTDYTFSSTQGTFSRISDMLGRKMRPDKFKKSGIISRSISDHKTMILEVNHKKILLKMQTHNS